jgi:hypothetical protein
MSTRSRARAPLARRLRVTAVACGLALQGADAAAQAAAPAARNLDARTRIGAEFVHLPGGERMGLVGLTELLHVGGEWWLGPGVYGAATGRRGGLFVPGVEGAWSHPFNDWLAVDAGVFAGGGGGGNAPVGGGLMLRPHVDLVFRLPGFYTGPTWSTVRFPNGSIDSHQFGWMLNFDSRFRFRPADTLGAGAPVDGSASGLGFDRIDATFTAERPRNATLTSGLPMTQTVGLVGIRAERTVSGPLWAGIETAGAASGGVAGYAEILGTAGLRWQLAGDRLGAGVRASLGLGGGGAIDTGGGPIAKAAAGLTLRLTDTLGLGAEAGYVKAARHGSFQATTAALSLNWQLDTPRRSGFDASAAPLEATRTEFVSGVERYDAARKTGPARPLEAVVLAMNRFITPAFYVTGQAHSAFGGGAGAYSVGLFGLGTQWPVASRLRVGAEALAGAAGGGGVDTEGGALLQARAYADLALTDALSLRVGGGKVKSVHGGVDAPVVDAALVFRFGIDRRR